MQLKSSVDVSIVVAVSAVLVGVVAGGVVFGGGDGGGVESSFSGLAALESKTKVKSRMKKQEVGRVFIVRNCN